MQKYLFSLFLFTLTFIFWGLTPDSFLSPKILIFVIFSLTLLTTYFLKSIHNKNLTLPSTTLTLPLLSFMLAIGLSLAFNPEGRPEALLSKAAYLLILPLLTLISFSLRPKANHVNFILHTILGTTSLLSLHSLLQLTLIPRLSWVPSFLQTKAFTPTGDFLTTLILLLLGLIISLYFLSINSSKLRPLYLGTTIFSIIAIVAIASLMIPGSTLALRLLPYDVSWAITLDTLKSLHSLFFGVGLANYTLLFNAIKPLALNATDLWNFLPQNGTSELLTMIATSGILGGLSLTWLFISALRSATHTPLYYPLLFLIVVFIFTPGNLIIYSFFFLLLGLLPLELHESSLSSTKNSRLTVSLSLAFLAVTFFGLSFSLRGIISQYYFGKAQHALAQNDGKTVYDSELSAIKYSPKVTLYHLSFSEINLSLAGSLSQKPNLSDEDKATVSQLVQQAISESKTAISLEPNNSAGWLTLGKTYRNLIGVASGADTFATTNYAKAVQLDPGNPMLRVEFGNLLYQLKQYDRAKTEFQTAIQLRSNYPNAYYNLAKLYETMGDYENSYLAMQKTVSLLGPGNSDLGQAQSELDTIKSKLPKPTPTPLASPSTSEAPAAGTSPLTTPTPLPSPIPGNPIQL